MSLRTLLQLQSIESQSFPYSWVVANRFDRLRLCWLWFLQWSCKLLLRINSGAPTRGRATPVPTLLISIGSEVLKSAMSRSCISEDASVIELEKKVVVFDFRRARSLPLGPTINVSA